MLFNFFYNKLNKKTIFLLIVALLISGQLLNIFIPHHLFHVDQIILLTMFVIQIVVLKEIKIEKEEIKKCIMSKNEPEVLSLFTIKVEKILCSYIGDMISVTLVIFYILTMFAVKCLEITVTGIYGGILGGVVFYVGIQAYIHYIALLYFAYDLRHIQISDYSFYFPALTNWIRRLVYCIIDK